MNDGNQDDLSDYETDDIQPKRISPAKDTSKSGAK